MCVHPPTARNPIKVVPPALVPEIHIRPPCATLKVIGRWLHGWMGMEDVACLPHSLGYCVQDTWDVCVNRFPIFLPLCPMANIQSVLNTEFKDLSIHQRCFMQ